jgi:hypothetical protein
MGLTLSHHAAMISTFLGNMELVKHYYQQSLSFSPENPRALIGLANAARSKASLNWRRTTRRDATRRSSIATTF